MPTELDEIIESPKTDDERRVYAIRRIREKDDFRTHLMVYLAINAILVVIWWMATGARGFFWPILSILGWGFGLAMHAYTVYRGHVVTETQIKREIKQLTH